jgi:hypothetical protein
MHVKQPQPFVDRYRHERPPNCGNVAVSV